MIRVIRALLGKSRREADAAAEMEQHREEQARAMQAVAMKVAALDIGAQRVVSEGQKTEAAAAELVRTSERAAQAMLRRLREDMPYDVD